MREAEEEEVVVEIEGEAEEGNWFSRWEEDLPSPEELMPLTQTLITPDLAMAFDIPTHHSSSTPSAFHTPSSSHHHHHQADFDSGDLNGSSGGGGSGGGEEPARTLKRPRLVWTPQLHKRFVDAVAHLGIKNAVPKTIMQLMSVDGLTRENVASHLQKYRLYLKRMQGLNSSGGGGGGGPASCSPADAATDQLFASGPIPRQFLTRGGGGGGGNGGVAGPTEPPPFMPFVPVAALQHHQQMVAAAAAAAAQHQQYYQQRQQMGFDHGFLRAPPPGFNRMGLHGMVQPVSASAYNMDDLEEGNRGGGGGGGRKVLTLFPTGDDR